MNKVDIIAGTDELLDITLENDKHHSNYDFLSSFKDCVNKQIILCAFIVLVLGIFFYYYSNKINDDTEVYSKVQVNSILNNFFTALKEGDFNKASIYLDKTDPYYNLDFNFKSKTYEKLLKQVFSKVDYKIKSSVIKSKSAEVKLEITSVDLLKIYNDNLSNQINPLISKYMSGDSKEKEKIKNEIKSILMPTLDELLNDNNYPKFKSDLKITLVKQDGKWLIKPDSDFIYAVTGRMSGLMSK